MSALLLLLLGCGSTPETVSSVPTEPVVELGGERPQSDITWETLKGLLAEGEPSFPAALPGLAIGLPEVEARAILDGARDKKLLVPPDQTLDDLSVTSARLQAYPDVGVTLIFKGGEVFEVDLSLPADEAVFAATTAWGKPDQQTIGKKGTIPQPTWVHEGLEVRLIETDGPAILKYSRME